MSIGTRTRLVSASFFYCIISPPGATGRRQAMRTHSTTAGPTGLQKTRQHRLSGAVRRQGSMRYTHVIQSIRNEPGPDCDRDRRRTATPRVLDRLRRDRRTATPSIISLADKTMWLPWPRRHRPNRRPGHGARPTGWQWRTRRRPRRGWRRPAIWRFLGDACRGSRTCTDRVGSREASR